MKTPATTMVDLCSSAETGVGPSIAEGSQGWSLNCADLPAAAKIIPKIAHVEIKELLLKKIISLRFQDL